MDCSCDRLDDQLAAATDRSQVGFDDRRPAGAPPAIDAVLALPGQPAGTLAALVPRWLLIRAAILDSAGAADRALRCSTICCSRCDRPAPRTLTSATLGSVPGGRACQQRETATCSSSGCRSPTLDATVAQLALLDRRDRARRRSLAARLAGAVRRAASRCDRSTASPPPRPGSPNCRSIAATSRSPSACPPRTPTRAPRSVGWGRRSTDARARRIRTHRASGERAASVRTFVADASHELRTPLASIRGYAELTRRGGHELPDDVVHAIGRVESESVRMTALVEDLLLLARLDDGRDPRGRPRRPVPPARGCRERRPRRRVPTTSGASTCPNEPVHRARGRHRGCTRWSRTCWPTRACTPLSGTTVTTSARREGADGGVAVGDATDRVVLEVHDDGPGIDPQLVPTVFERFARGDGSRAQGDWRHRPRPCHRQRGGRGARRARGRAQHARRHRVPGDPPSGQ